MGKVVCFIKKSKFFIERSQHKDDKNLNANNTLNVEFPSKEETLEDFVIRICKKYGDEVLDNKWSGDYKEMTGHIFYGEERQFKYAISTITNDYNNAQDKIKKLRETDSFKMRLVKEVFGFKIFKVEHISNNKYQCIYANDSEHYEVPFLLRLNVSGNITDEVKGTLESINLLEPGNVCKIQEYIVSLSKINDKIFVELENQETNEVQEYPANFDIKIIDEPLDYMSEDIKKFVLSI